MDYSPTLLANNIQLNTASIYSDLNSLNTIREKATTDSRAAIKQAAKEFEAFFMNMMLKSMRQAGEVLAGDSLFGSQQEKMFIGMLDEQMSVELSQKGKLGIADLMTQNLLPETNQNNTISSRPSQDFVFPSNQPLNKPTEEIKSAKPIASKIRPSEINPQNGDADITFGLIDNPLLRSQWVGNETQSIELVINKNNTDQKKIESSAHPLSTKVNKGITESKIMVESKKPLFDTARQFIKKLLPIATNIAKKIGLDPKLMIAQAALETGWGKYIMHDNQGVSSNNLFGIKSSSAWQGSSLNIDTLEVEDGTFVKTKGQFRMYDSFEKSFNDYIDFLQANPRYQEALQQAKNPHQFIRSLQLAGYATDPNYAKKILTIYNRELQTVKNNANE